MYSQSAFFRMIFGSPSTPPVVSSDDSNLELDVQDPSIFCAEDFIPDYVLEVLSTQNSPNTSTPCS